MVTAERMTMGQFRGLVDEIRTYVNSADQTEDEDVAAKARDYAQACRHVNGRLQRCGDMLTKGHRPEAIAIAEAEPDLLELVSVLNFPELDEWQESVATYGWERFQTLKLDIASATNEAYAAEQRLGDLLSQHRRLALAQAPVKDRLGVMRRIAEIDTTVPFWHEDVATFEAHRAKELLVLGEKVRDDRDPHLMKQFIEQYDGERWQTTIPQELEQLYRGMFIKLHGTVTLPRLAQRLSHALTSLDIRCMKSLAGRWDGIISKIEGFGVGWKVPQELRVKVQPALEYLREHDSKERHAAFQRDVHALVQAIREQDGLEKVEFLASSAESHGFALSNQVLAELAQYHKGAKREVALNIAVISTLVVAGIVFLILTYFVLQTMTSSNDKPSAADTAERSASEASSSPRSVGLNLHETESTVPLATPVLRKREFALYLMSNTKGFHQT